MSSHRRAEYTCTNCADGPLAEVTVVVVGNEVETVECPECGEDMTVLQGLEPRVYE